MRKKWMMLVIVVMFFLLLPVGIAQAATYEMKADPQQNKMLYVDEMMTVRIRLFKNGEKVDNQEEWWLPIKWESSNKKVVEIVDTNGHFCSDLNATVRGVKTGSATITAKYKGVTYSYKLTVKKNGIRPFDSYSRVAYVTEGYDIGMNIYGWSKKEISNVKFSTKDPSIAKCIENESSEMVIKGVKQGKTTLIAKSGKKTLKLKVIVLPRMSLRVKNFEVIKKNGELVGFRYDATNKGTRPVEITKSYIGCGSEFFGYRTTIEGGQCDYRKRSNKACESDDRAG